MKDNKIDSMTGNAVVEAGSQASPSPCVPGMGLRRPSGSQAIAGAVVQGGRAVGQEGQSWLRRNKLLIAGAVIFTYVLIARLLGDGTTST